MATMRNSLVLFSENSYKSIYPTENEVIESLSYFIQDKLKEYNEKDQSYSDPEYQSSENLTTTNLVKSKICYEFPNSKEIFSHIYDLSFFAKLNSECLTISYIYMNRFLKESKIMLSNFNWREIITLSAWLAQKICCYDHKDIYEFSLFLPQLDPTDLSYMEFEFLHSFNYEYKLNLWTFEAHYYNLHKIHHSHNHCIWLYNTKIVETAIKRSEWLTPQENDGDLKKFISISQSNLNLDELEDA